MKEVGGSKLAVYIFIFPIFHSSTTCFKDRPRSGAVKWRVQLTIQLSSLINY